MADEEDKVSRMICERCEGASGWDNTEDDGEGRGRSSWEDCPDCDASGMLLVNVFMPVCAHHCNMCEGEDHHWLYGGGEDTNGMPVMECKHCPAKRHMNEEDDLS